MKRSWSAPTEAGGALLSLRILAFAATAPVLLARTRLADLSLQFEASERLPITVSAGICVFPINGESMTTPDWERQPGRRT